jgi:hypothetical protein
MKYIVAVNIRIQQEDRGMSGGIEIREETNVNANGFMEICAILAKFHEVVQALQVAKK